jgi:hypothetical protein
MTAQVIVWPAQWRVRDSETILIEASFDVIDLELARVLVRAGYNLRPLPGGGLRLTKDATAQERARHGE